MRRPVTVHLSVLTLLGVLLVPSGAGAAQRPAGAPPDPAVALTPMEDLVAQHALDGRRDPAARAAAMRTFVTQRWDLGQPVPGVEEPVDVQHTIYPYPTGDLDGDGGADVIVNASSYPDGPEVLEARSGADGSQLWEVVSDEPVGRFGWPIGVDLDGDGAEDVLEVVTIEHASTVTDTCVTGELFNCTITDEVEFTTTATIRSGADGTVVWAVSRDGHDHYETGHSGTPAGYEAWQRLESTSSQITPYLGGDHDGDGVRDLVLSVRGFHWDDQVSGYDLLVAADYTGHSYSHFDHESVIVSGATGTETPVRSVTRSVVAGDLRPLDGDGDALLWTSSTRPNVDYVCAYTPVDGGCTYEEVEETAAVEVLDGQTFATRWGRTVAVGDDARPVGADLTGDGAAEVFLDGLVEVDGEQVDGGAVLDGATGSALWGREGSWVPQVVPSLDGGPGADVVRTSSMVLGRLVERIDGATGEPLLVTGHTADPEGADDVFVRVQPTGDVTGDGVADLAWRVHRLDRSDPCPEIGDGGSSCWYLTYGVDSQVWIEDTVTGEVVVPERRVDGYGLLEGVGDLDGDGRPDVLSTEAGDGPIAYRGLDVATGEAMWTATFAEVTALLGMGDMDGDGRADLLLDAIEEDDGVRTSDLGHLSGVDGAERWRVTYDG